MNKTRSLHKKKGRKLEHAQYNLEQKGEKDGYVRESKLLRSLHDNFITTIDLDKDKNIIVVMTLGKVANMYAARYDTEQGHVSIFQEVALKNQKMGARLKEMATFAVQKAKDESSNVYSDKSRYLAILCKGDIYRARIKMSNITCSFLRKEILLTR
jgi:hypothetical protein